MLQRNNLSALHAHQDYLKQLLAQEDIFVVGGCIRDLLLGITTDPKDIDITMSSEPDTIRDWMNFDDTTTARFRTQKFGTMTFLPKENNYEYELTPFRTEWGYTDVRHPDEITRSSDLLLDSNRRDFRINCLYRLGATLGTSADRPWVDHSIEVVLKNHWIAFLADSRVLIIQDQEKISALLPNWKLDQQKCEYLVKTCSCITSDEETTLTPGPISIIIDPHLGINDLLNQKLQTVWDPNDRFTEDALRILRGVRFVNTLNQVDSLPHLDFNSKTRKAMKLHAQLVESLSSERIHDEIVKVFSKHNPFGYIALLKELDILKFIFPSVHETIGNHQPTRHHSLDTYHHILMTLKAIQEIIKQKNTDSNDPQTHQDMLVKIAMLYHDVGKPEQYENIAKAIEENPDNPDRSQYLYHTESWALMAQEDLKKLTFSKKDIETVMRYIRRHHRPGEILEWSETKQTSRLRKLLSDWGIEKCLNLMDITIADRTGQYNPMQSSSFEDIHSLKALLQNIYDEEGQFTIKDLAVNGNDLMKELDIKAGPELGELIKKAFEWVLMDVKVRNERESIYRFIREIEKERNREMEKERNGERD